MFKRRPSVNFVRELACFLLSTMLIAAPALALPVKPRTTASPLAVFSLSNLRASLRTQLQSWIPSLFLSPYAMGATLQTGTTPNLDTLRGTTPQAPNAYTQGALPAASYLDPKPTVTGNFNTYFTQLTEPNNPSGPIGALPMQAPDPTAGASVVGGLSVDLITRHFNWMAPVMSLPGRAGLGVGLGLSYSSNVWVNNAFNTDRGFPGPGWRLGFGSLLFTNPPSAWGYTNATTGTFSMLYLAPDGTRHALKHNSASGLYETYDSTYLSFNATTSILTTASGTQLYFGALSMSAVSRDFQAYVTKVTDRHGNFVNVTYKTLSNEAMVPDYVTDTAGHRIDFEYTNNRLTAVKQIRGSNTFYFVRIDYGEFTMQVDPNNTDPPGLNGAQVWLPVKLTYPTGVNYRFTYSVAARQINLSDRGELSLHL